MGDQQGREDDEHPEWLPEVSEEGELFLRFGCNGYGSRVTLAGLAVGVASILVGALLPEKLAVLLFCGSFGATVAALDLRARWVDRDAAQCSCWTSRRIGGVWSPCPLLNAQTGGCLSPIWVFGLIVICLGLVLAFAR